MRKERIDFLIEDGQLRPRYHDIERIKSMISSSRINAEVVKKIPVSSESATVIFREIYESIRKLGDARWWLLGYEPLNHEVSLEILKEAEVKEKIKLNHLLRFKKIRNDINYRGFRASEPQAQEILDFWDTCGKEISNLIERSIK